MNEPIQVEVEGTTIRISPRGHVAILQDGEPRIGLPEPRLYALIRDLAAELARARRDSERLDWLERQRKITCVCTEWPEVGCFLLDEHDEEMTGTEIFGTLRAAIDAAAQPPTGTGE